MTFDTPFDFPAWDQNPVGPTPLFELDFSPSLAAPPGLTISDVSALPVASGSVEIDFTPNWSTAPTGVLISTIGDNALAPHAGLEIYVFTDQSVHVFFQNAAIANTDLGSIGLTWVAGHKYLITAVWGGGNAALYRDGVLVASITNGSAVMPDGHAAMEIGFATLSGVPADSADGTFQRVAFFAG